MKNIEKFFPFSTIREQQLESINFAINAFEQGKKYVILELGTGCGKSAISMTIAKYFNELLLGGSYILTTQKILQQQYLDDFSSNHNLVGIKSSKNYTCSFYRDQSCSDSKTILSQIGEKISDSDFYKNCKFNCKYSRDKQRFIDSPFGITNFSYFFTETIYAKKLEPRELLIVDECHNIENELSRFVEISFSEKFSKSVLSLNFPKDLSSMSKVFDWVKKDYLVSLRLHASKIEEYLTKNLDENSQMFGDLSKQYDMLVKHISKIQNFAETFEEDNWVYNVIENEKSKESKKIEFKPIDVSRFGEDYLFRFGKKVLLLSATIVDKDTFCKTVGINPEEAAFLSIPSPFDVKNRPIHFIPAGSMSLNNIEKTLPVMVEAIKMILKKHSKEKGIIHCNSFKIANFISQNIRDKRIISHDSSNREQALNEHINSKLNSVLLSPSMTEGVNLYDDLSRFQIICKVPYPYLGDKSIKKKMQINNDWYGYQTAKTIIQAIGRSVRNENDKAISYILDKDWEYFFSKNRKFFQKDFIESLS